MIENKRKWKKMIEKWRKMKNWKKNEKKGIYEKNEKNEKMKKWKNEIMKKNEKNGEKWWKKKEKWKKWIHTQNPLRFPGFTVVVVTFFVKILDDFHDFVSECVSFPRKINNPFWGVIVFPKKSDNFSLDVKQQYTFHWRKSTKQNR